jgi:hypothetical protein
VFCEFYWIIYLSTLHICAEDNSWLWIDSHEDLGIWAFLDEKDARALLEKEVLCQ